MRDQAEAAISEYQTAIKLKPDSFEAHANLGDIYLQLGRYSDAIEPLRHAVELKPHSVEVRDCLGVAFLKSGDRDRAMEEFRVIDGLRPEFEGELAKLLRLENAGG